MTDTRLELKSFVFQVEQMRMAQERLKHLKEGAEAESENAIQQTAEMKRQLEIVVDDSIKEFRKRNDIRIAPEQVDADDKFRVGLMGSLTAWVNELEQVQKDLVEQAIIDVQEARKSARYDALEKREAALKIKIREAEEKLGMVNERVHNPAFSNAISDAVNNAKR